MNGYFVVLTLICVMAVCQAQVDTGIIECGGSSGWEDFANTAGRTGRKQRVVNVSFGVNYRKTPKVYVSFGELDTDAGKNLRVTAVLNSVSQTGFQAACQTWFDTTVYSMKLHWISVNDGYDC